VFEREKIILDIPKEGIVLENGWTITPHTYPGVSPIYHSSHLGLILTERGRLKFTFVE